jgi:hypothetical protein
VFSSPEIEQEVKDRLDDTNVVITNKNKAIKEVEKLANDIEQTVTPVEKVSKQPTIIPEVKEVLKETAKEVVVNRNVFSELVKLHDIKSKDIKSNIKKKKEKEKQKNKPSTSIFENVIILKERSPSPSSS